MKWKPDSNSYAKPLDTNPSAAKSATRTRPCGASSNLQPLFGPTYDDTVHYADNNSFMLSIAHPRSLKIEPEIVFGLKQSVTEEPADAGLALARVAWLALGFEIIDCPFPNWKFQPSDFVASFGLHAALVVGQKIPVQPNNSVNLLDQLSA